MYLFLAYQCSFDNRGVLILQVLSKKILMAPNAVFPLRECGSGARVTTGYHLNKAESEICWLSSNPLVRIRRGRRGGRKEGRERRERGERDRVFIEYRGARTEGLS